MPSDFKMAKLTVSAVIPVFNGESRISDAIESALGQTHPLIDIVVVDDGSTDETLSVAKRYPVTVISQQNAGPGAARNTGAYASRGDWLAFLDHDDKWHPEKTERQLAVASDPRIGVVYSPRRKRDDVPITWDNLWAYNIVGTPTGTLVRRSCFFDVGGFDVRRALIGTEDYNLWMRIALTDWRFAKCAGDLFEYTPEANSLSTRYERMAAAECESLQDLGEQAGLSRRDVGQRKIAVANHYIRELIGTRNLVAARRMIFAAGVLNVRPDLVAAAFSPAWAFRFRKVLRAKFV